MIALCQIDPFSRLTLQAENARLMDLSVEMRAELRRTRSGVTAVQQGWHDEAGDVAPELQTLEAQPHTQPPNAQGLHCLTICYALHVSD